jgi:OOP family OmpA-OmpF porin
MRFLTGALSLLAVSGLQAQTAGPARQDWLQVKGAYFKPDGGPCLDTSFGPGLGLGTWLSNRWGVELDLLDTKLKSRVLPGNAHEQHLAAGALFNLNPGGTVWFPYLKAGAGGVRVGSPYSLSTGSSTFGTLHGGVGIQRFFATHGIASLEARAVGISGTVRRNEYQGLVGLGCRWGGASPAPAPAAPVALAPAPVPPAPSPVQAPPVAAPAPVPAPAPPAQVAAPPARIILDDALLLFANNQAVLPPQGVEAIRLVAKGLKAHTGTYSLLVTGHTSSLGGKAWNKTLSLRRAEAVAQVLIAEGIPADHVKTAGLGPDRPIADNATREGQARNRRVEIEVAADGVEVRHREAALQE